MPVSCQKSDLRQREDVHGSHFLNSIQRLVTIAMGIQPLVTMAMIIQRRVTMKMGTGPNFKINLHVLNYLWTHFRAFVKMCTIDSSFGHYTMADHGLVHDTTVQKTES